MDHVNRKPPSFFAYLYHDKFNVALTNLPATGFLVGLTAAYGKDRSRNIYVYIPLNFVITA